MCFSIAKYLLFAFNFVFWAAGAACLGVGIWLNVDESVQDSISIAGVDIFFAGAYVLIVAGAIMLVVGFFGCCGAIKESQCLLGLYFGCLFVVFGLQVGIGIWALVEYDSFQEIIDDSLKDFDFADASEQNVLIGVEKNLECCGSLKGCQDWSESNQDSLGCGCNPDSFTNKSYCVQVGGPGSNCRIDSSYEGTPGDYVYAQPCNEAIYKFLSDNMIIVGAVALAIGLAEIIGMIVSMCLCCSIKDK